MQSVAAATPLEGPSMQRYCALAQANRLWLSLGGFQEYCSTDPKRLNNCHVVVNGAGQIVSTYRKIHLFDVEVFNGPVLKETSFTVPGKQVSFLSGHPYKTQSLQCCTGKSNAAPLYVDAIMVFLLGPPPHALCPLSLGP